MYSYNSVIYTTTTANEYVALAVNEGFLEGQAVNLSAASDLVVQTSKDLQIKAMSNQLQKLDDASCIETYSNNLINEYSNVVLVVELTARFPNASLYPKPSANSSATHQYVHHPQQRRVRPSHQISIGCVMIIAVLIPLV